MAKRQTAVPQKKRGRRVGHTPSKERAGCPRSIDAARDMAIAATPGDDPSKEASTPPPVTEARQGAFLAALRATGNVRSACEAAKVGRRTAYHWREDATFKAQWDEALQDACDLLEREARRRAVDGWPEPVWHKGEMCGTVQKYSDRMLELLLIAHRPEKFRSNYTAQASASSDESSKRLDLAESGLPGTLTPKQLRFFRSPDPLFLFCGGVGSGKSFAGGTWSLAQSIRYPKARGFVGANTYLQLSKSTLPHLWRLLRQHRIAFVYGKQPPAAWGIESPFPDHKNVISLQTGAQILTYSLDNYDAMRGIEVAWAWIDETRDTAKEAFEVLLERLRGFDDIYPGLGYPLRVTTTPNGFDWLWERFVDPDHRMPGAGYVTATSYENPHNPPNYAADLEARLGKQLAQQQIHAEFLNLAVGRAYAFKRQIHVGPVFYRPELPIIIGHDFNVAPLCAVAMQIDRAKRTVEVLDEIVIPDSAQTRESAAEISRRFKDCRQPGSTVKAGPMAQMIVFADAAGRSRDTRGTQSDLAILLAELRKTFPEARDGTPSCNPLVVDRVNALNALLDPAKGPPRIRIGPNCAKLIRDLEQVSFKPGTREIDKGNGQLTHLSDALGYPIAAVFPVGGDASGYSW
jgi:hypothetical protein